jgi:hypothetical protein
VSVRNECATYTNVVEEFQMDVFIGAGKTPMYELHVKHTLTLYTNI